MKAQIQNITDAEYFASLRMSKHSLDEFSKNPWGFLKARAEGVVKDDDETGSLLFGGAVHVAVLQPEKVADAIAICPETIKARRGKEWEKFSVENDGKLILKGDEFNKMQAAAESIKASELAYKLIGVSEMRETAIFWTADGFDDVPLKSKIDAMSVVDGKCDLVIDLKTTKDASPEAFAKSCETYGYHRQAAFYLDAVSALYGKMPDGFVFVVVENEYPFTPAVYTFDWDSEFILAGRAGYLSQLREYHEFSTGEKVVPTGFAEHNLPLPAWSKDLARLKTVIGG